MSQTNHIIVKQSGSSSPFRIDVIGELNRRDLYDKEEKGFTFLDSSNKVYYYKKSSSNADWSEGIPFVGSLSNTFKEGIEIGDYKKKVSGAKIDKDGNGEFRNLFLDTLFIKNELTGTYETVDKVIERISIDTFLGDSNLRMEIYAPNFGIIIDDLKGSEIVLEANVFRYYKTINNKITKWEWTRDTHNADLDSEINDIRWNDLNKDRNNRKITIKSEDLAPSLTTFTCVAYSDDIELQGLTAQIQI